MLLGFKENVGQLYGWMNIMSYVWFVDPNTIKKNYTLKIISLVKERGALTEGGGGGYFITHKMYE